MRRVIAASTCRSYSSQAFDGCEGCRNVALDAVAQSGLYVLARVSPGMAPDGDGPLELSHALRIRVFDESGAELAADEIEADQSIAAVGPNDELEMDGLANFPSDETTMSTMRLDDFQAVIDRLELGPNDGSVAGIVGGKLFAYERLVGAFEIEVSPGH